MNGPVARVRRSNPFSRDAGYVTARKAAFGWAIVYDRKNGGDWIDADTRWVVAAYDQDEQNIGLLDCPTRQIAGETMADAADGSDTDWIDADLLPDGLPTG